MDTNLMINYAMNQTKHIAKHNQNIELALASLKEITHGNSLCVLTDKKKFGLDENDLNQIRAIIKLLEDAKISDFDCQKIITASLNQE